MNKICPIRTGSGQDLPCREDCAWYDEEFRGCSLHGLGTVLYRMKEAIRLGHKIREVVRE